MVLPASGAISIGQINTEFGRGLNPNPQSLSEYYRGGTYVTNWSRNNAIPTSGAISLSNFRGAEYARPFEIKLLKHGTPFAETLFSSTADPRRNIIAVQMLGAGNTGMLPAPFATMDGVPASGLVYQNSTVSDDGQSITITSFLVPTGVPTIRFPDGTGTCAVYEVFGVYDIPGSRAGTVLRFNADGGDRPLVGGPDISISTPANSFVLYVGVANQHGAFGGDPTGRLNVGAINPGGRGIVGFDTQPNLGSTFYDNQFALNWGIIAAISFIKNPG